MKKVLVISGLAANFAILLYFWWQFSGTLILSGETNSQFIAISRLAGLLATQLALLQLILIGRVKWVESVFGLDKLSRVHKWNGYAVLGLIILHVVLITKAYSVLNQVEFLTQYQNLITNSNDIFKAFLAYLILLLTVGLSITIVRRKLKYEHWYYVHILNYLTFILFVSHQLELGTISDSVSFKTYWIVTYVFVALHILWFRFLKPAVNLKRFDFTVTKIEDLGTATSIYITGRNLKNFKRSSGQFMILRFLQKGFWYEAHPFSLSLSGQANQLRITAKKLGDFTNKLKSLKIGTKVLIDGPHGVFTQTQIKKDKVLFIAGGIGITPIRSLIEDIANTKQVTLLYSAKNPTEAVLLNELIDIQKSHPFRLTMIYSEAKIADAEFGLLDKTKLIKLVPDLADYDVFLCGPPPMMVSVKNTLSDLGLPKKQLHWEKFAL